MKSDLGDATILPGFIELHAHLSFQGIPADTVLKHGITTIRDVGGPADNQTLSNGASMCNVTLHRIARYNLLPWYKNNSSLIRSKNEEDNFNIDAYRTGRFDGLFENRSLHPALGCHGRRYI